MSTSSVKKNFGWNFVLMISEYLFPLLTYPYITRVLGAESLGIGNFVLSIIDYAVLFSTFGIASIGYRYIPQCNEDKEKRNHVFCSLVSLHLIMSVVVLVVYILAVYTLPQLQEHKYLYIVGATKVFLNVFLVEWLFEGMQDFRYITIRTIAIRMAYVIGIFIFIHTSDDYDRYVYITIGQVVINSIINWKYSKRFVTFSFRLSGIKEFVFPVISMGINRILLSFYSTFNVLFLGFACSNLAVGYFTTATKLYSIFIGLISAFNGVLVPHINALIGQGDIEGFKSKVSLSFSLVNVLSIPFTVVAIIMAPEIIRFVAGEGYESAILPFQIISIQITLVGMAQVTENQILLSLKRFKEVLFCTLVSTLFSIGILLFYAKRYAEVAGALAVAIPHFIECILLLYYAKRAMNFEYPLRELLITVLVSIPIVFICFVFKMLCASYLLALSFGVSISFIYYFVIQYYVIKNSFIVSQIDSFLKIKKK